MATDITRSSCEPSHQDISGPQMLERIRQEPRLQNLKVVAISGASPTDLGIPVGGGGVSA
jgi:CheY-like chemotaxis protein